VLGGGGGAGTGGGRTRWGKLGFFFSNLSYFHQQFDINFCWFEGTGQVVILFLFCFFVVKFCFCLGGGRGGGGVECVYDDVLWSSERLELYTFCFCGL